MTHTPLPPLRRRSLERARRDGLVGRYLLWYDSVDSTNNVLKAAAEQGAPDGTVAVAEYQTAGRGREQRRWWSPPRANLLFSVLFRPPFPMVPADVHQLTMICSLAACEAVSRVVGLQPALKWPNDLLLGGRKLGGVLSESAFTGEALAYAVVGLGLNVNDRFAPAAEGASGQDQAVWEGQATSLLLHGGREVDRTALLQAILEQVDGRYDRLRAGERFHGEWGRRLATLGQQVSVLVDGEVLLGQAVGVDADGSLLLRQEDGALRRILVGDVTQLRPLT
ncbi:MAG: biotin--[acetyl-CoA-carboxylase] ligase [Chloroflexi bacterium]|nr:biotin--[acetyl-CoA-carboxylase] ligase [Chloroflexota bacterium]